MTKNKSDKGESGIQEKKAKFEAVKDNMKLYEEKQTPLPELYTIPPQQPKEKKPGQFTEAQLKQFFEKGYVLVEDFFNSKRLQFVRDAIDELVDDLANKLHNAGKIKNKHEDKGFANRLTYLETEFKGATVLMAKQGILHKAFQDLWADERLLNVAEQIVGPDISGHPVWNLRTKIPHNEQTTVPWHQDNAYLHPCALEAMTLTAWVPLVDADKINGCMQIAAGGHRKGKTARHTCCAGGTWYVQLEEEDMIKELDVDMKDVVTCEVPFGGVLFLNNSVPHRSLENRSQIIRWSLDLRWHRSDKDNGFYGLKDSVLMRTCKDPNYKIDWTNMIGIDRSKVQTEAVGEEEDEFSTEIAGPWMRRWDIVHHNRHTESLSPEESSWQKA